MSSEKRNARGQRSGGPSEVRDQSWAAMRAAMSEAGSFKLP